MPLLPSTSCGRGRHGAQAREPLDESRVDLLGFVVVGAVAALDKDLFSLGVRAPDAFELRLSDPRVFRAPEEEQGQAATAEGAQHRVQCQLPLLLQRHVTAEAVCRENAAEHLWRGRVGRREHDALHEIVVNATDIHLFEDVPDARGLPREAARQPARRRMWAPQRR